MQNYNWTITFAVLKMVIVAQLVRASVCGTEGRGFEPHHSPQKASQKCEAFFYKTFRMSYFVYILQSESTGKFYIGQTNDLISRLNAHNSGYSKYTKNKGPWVVFYSIALETRSEAMILEKKLKNMKSRKRLIAWINSQTT